MTNSLYSQIGDRNVRLLDWVCLLVWAVIAVVGYLQTKQIYAGWMTNYGGDVFGTMAFWWGLRRTLFVNSHRGAEIAAAIQFVGCCVWEICQAFDFSGTPLAITKGTFDPYDFVAYLATVLFCFCLEKCLHVGNIHKQQSLNNRIVD